MWNIKHVSVCVFRISLMWCAVAVLAEAKNTNLEEAQAFLDDYNDQAMVVYYQSALASWIYNTNITDYNQRKEVRS